MNDATLGRSASSIRSSALDVGREPGPLLYGVAASPDTRTFAVQIRRMASDGVAATGQLTYE